MEVSKFKSYHWFIVIIWLLPFAYLPGVDFIYGFLPDNSPWFNFDLAYYFYYHFLFIAVLFIVFYKSKVDLIGILGGVKKTDLVSGVKLTMFVFLFSMAAAYGFFYPLSFYNAEFVNYWFIDIPPSILGWSDSYPLLPNLLSFASLCLFAPVIEELAFRGVLLHSWQSKIGLNKAILYSSALFGLAHPDPIGATAFGVAMCILYLRTQSILVPIICHSANNLLCWLIEAGYFYKNGPDYVYTLEEFRSEWFLGVISFVIVVVWACMYFKSKHENRVWVLPTI